MDLPSLTVTLTCSTSPSLKFSASKTSTAIAFSLSQARHFLRCVETREKPVVDLADGIQSLRMALAVKQSIAEHSPIDLV